MLVWKVSPSEFLFSLNEKDIFVYWINLCGIDDNLSVVVVGGGFTDSFFKDSSVEERGHAEKFMEYQVWFQQSIMLIMDLNLLVCVS